MATYHESFRLHLNQDYAHSSVLLGPDNPQPERRADPERQPPADFSPYIDKPLPPIPPRRSSKRKPTGSVVNPSKMIAPIRHQMSASVLGRSQNELLVKSPDLRFSFEPRASKLFELADGVTPFSAEGTEGIEISQKIADKASLERNPTLVDSDSSIRSVSVYADDADQIDAIVNCYNEWGSSEPSWIRPRSRAPPSPKSSSNLQAVRHSRSALELGDPRCTTGKLHSHVLPIPRPLSRFDPDFSQFARGGERSKKSVTFEDSFLETKDQLACISVASAQRVWEQNSRKLAGENRDDMAPPVLASAPRPMSSSTDFPAKNAYVEDYHEIIRNLTSQGLQLRPKHIPVSGHCINRFSDHSSDDDSLHSSIAIPHSSESVITHVRSNSPFRVPTRPSQIFREKAPTMSIQAPSPLPVATSTKRKRVFSNGTNFRKIPFSFNPLHKRVSTVVSPSGLETYSRNIPDKASPSFISTTISLTGPFVNNPNFSISMTPSTSNFATNANLSSSKQRTKYLSNYARRASGPATPAPDASHSFMNALTPLPPPPKQEPTSKPAKVLGMSTMIDSETIRRSGSSNISTREQISTRVSEALGGLKDKGKARMSGMSGMGMVFGRKSEEEKRRDALMKAIVVIGASDQSPNGSVTEWI